MTPAATNAGGAVGLVSGREDGRARGSGTERGTPERERDVFVHVRFTLKSFPK